MPKMQKNKKLYRLEYEKIYKKDINKVMPILQALAEGKTIQFAATDKEWIDSDGLSLETLINNPQAYRIKPKVSPFQGC